MTLHLKAAQEFWQTHQTILLLQRLVAENTYQRGLRWSNIPILDHKAFSVDYFHQQMPNKDYPRMEGPPYRPFAKMMSNQRLSQQRFFVRLEGTRYYHLYHFSYVLGRRRKHINTIKREQILVSYDDWPKK